MEPVGVAEAFLRVGAAMLAGLLIGLERERLDKVAGLRTLALVSSGSAIFVLSASVSMPAESMRMAAGVATGIGFIGAGVIIQDRGQVLGLTTAATVWVAAALGICAGAGAYLLTAASTVLTLFVLSGIGMIDLSRIQKDGRTYEIVYATSEWDADARSQALSDSGLLVTLIDLSWSAERAVASWRAVGHHKEHDRAVDRLRNDSGVVSFRSRA